MQCASTRWRSWVGDVTLADDDADGTVFQHLFGDGSERRCRSSIQHLQQPSPDIFVKRLILHVQIEEEQVCGSIAY
jgi:hypothetical protein